MATFLEQHSFGLIAKLHMHNNVPLSKSVHKTTYNLVTDNNNNQVNRITAGSIQLY